jgi:hypothetical protein
LIVGAESAPCYNSAESGNSATFQSDEKYGPEIPYISDTIDTGAHSETFP